MYLLPGHGLQQSSMSLSQSFVAPAIQDPAILHQEDLVTPFEDRMPV